MPHMEPPNCLLCRILSLSEGLCTSGATVFSDIKKFFFLRHVCLCAHAHVYHEHGHGHGHGHVQGHGRGIVHGHKIRILLTV